MNSLVELWGKGHSPRVEDPLIRGAVKNLNMLEAGFSIRPGDLSKLEVEMVNLVKGCIGEKKLKDQQKLNSRMKGV